MKPLNIVFQNPDPHQMDHCYKKQTILYYNPNPNPNPNNNCFIIFNISDNLLYQYVTL